MDDRRGFTPDHGALQPGTRQTPRHRGPALSGRAAAVTLCLILAIVFLAYFNTLWFQFVHDDRFQILGNSWLRSWKYLPRYFAADVWAFEHPVVRGTFYRPVFLLWFRLQYVVFGLHPWGWHLCTVLCHTGVTLLVYCVAVRLLADRLAALFAALIFGLHPAHAEGVAWVSGVTEPLFAVFLLASYLCYLNKRRDPTHAQIYLTASLVLYGLACLSKETALVLPLVIVACEILWSGNASVSGWKTWATRGGTALKVALPYFVLTFLYLAARVYSLQGFQNTKEAHSYRSMFLTLPSVSWFYIQHLVWPAHLSPFYSREFYSHIDIHHVVVPSIAVSTIALGLWLCGKRSPEAAVATIWTMVPILPVLNLRAFIEGHLVHDRYLYLPSFGFAVLFALGIRQISFERSRLLVQQAVQLAVIGIVALAMFIDLRQATACYANETAFFTYVTSMSSEGHGSSMDLAGILGNQGHLDEAIRIYQEIWPSQQDNWDVNYNLGYAYYLTGKLHDADRYLSRAVQLDASRPDGFLYLGLTKLKLGDINAAAADVQRAVIIRPDADHYHFALGVIFKLQGNFPAALSEFRQEMDVDPNNASARSQAEEIKAAMATVQRRIPMASAPATGALTSP